MRISVLGKNSSVNLAIGLAVLLPAICLAQLQDGATYFNDFDVRFANVPIEEIVHGGPKRDGVRSIDEPEFVKGDDVHFMRADDRIVRLGKKVYPLKILAYHKVVNDELPDGLSVAVFYDPISGVIAAFDRTVANMRPRFGVSGLIWNAQLLLYDRQSDSNSSLWSVATRQAITGLGARHQRKLKLLPFEMLHWQNVKPQRSSLFVLKYPTEFGLHYDVNPYARELEKDKPMFPARYGLFSVKRFKPKDEFVVIDVGGRKVGFALHEWQSASNQDRSYEYEGKKLSIRVTGDHNLNVYQQDKLQTAVYLRWFALRALIPGAHITKPSTTSQK